MLFPDESEKGAINHSYRKCYVNSLNQPLRSKHI